MSSPGPSSSLSSRRLAVIEAPSPLGLRPPSPGRVPGTRLMPRVLRELGLWRDLALASHVTLPEPVYSPEVDSSSGIRNLDAMVAFSRALAGEVSRAIDAGQTPIVIGGDCSVVLGPALALAPRGAYGLVYLDGHNDFAHEGNVGYPYPNVAGAALAVLTGRGPKPLIHIAGDGATPLFREDHILHLGLKAEPGTPDWLEDFAHTRMTRLPASAFQSRERDAIVAEVRRWLDASPSPGFWLHIDIDVLDPAVMPAVDSPDPGGLDWLELESLLAPLLRHPQLVGFNLGIYDPELDPDRRHARQIVDVLQRCLR